jgi:actin-related protein
LCGTWFNEDERNLVVPNFLPIFVRWEHMENVWHHAFYSELKMAPEDHRCLMAEAPLNSRANREKLS